MEPETNDMLHISDEVIFNWLSKPTQVWPSSNEYWLQSLLNVLS